MAREDEEERELEEAEIQLTGRDLAIESRMTTLVNQGLDQARNYQMEESYNTLQALKRLLPAIVQDLRAELKEEADLGKIKAEKKEGIKLEQKERKQEALLNAKEIKILQDILEMLRDIYKKEAKKKKGAVVSAELIGDIKKIKQNLSRFTQLERLEISDEMKKEMLKGEKHQGIINLIRSERQLFGLLMQYITKIEESLDKNYYAMTIDPYILKAIKLIKRLITINKAEIRSA